MVRPTGDDRPPSYQWTVLVIAACIVCMVLGALMLVVAVRIADAWIV